MTQPATPNPEAEALVERIVQHGNDEHGRPCDCRPVVIDPDCPHGRATYDRLRESLPAAIATALRAAREAGRQDERAERTLRRRTP